MVVSDTRMVVVSDSCACVAIAVAARRRLCGNVPLSSNTRGRRTSETKPHCSSDATAAARGARREPSADRDTAERTESSDHAREREAQSEKRQQREA